jgi:hypothetical protein
MGGLLCWRRTVLDPPGHALYIAAHDDVCCSFKAPPPPCPQGTGLTNVISVPAELGPRHKFFFLIALLALLR